MKSTRMAIFYFVHSSSCRSGSRKMASKLFKYDLYVQWGVKSVDPVGIKMIARLYTQLPYKLSVFLV